ncbi:MAG: sigma-70 family RNA polymerase sigma factor [bacterium]|nr:sigma-70 family RNA polymerase sigma factor [bacterium]
MALLSSNRRNEALTELYSRYGSRAFGYFFKMFRGDRDKAQDFVQELFLRILERHQQFDPSKKFSTWMFTIAGNMSKTSFRDEPTKLPIDGHEKAFFSDDDHTKNAFQDAMTSALNELDEVHRSAFILRYMNQLSLKEISEIEEIPLGTVKSRLFHATKKMAAALKEFQPNENNLFKLQ